MQRKFSKNSRTNRSGFTLIELVLAMAITMLFLTVTFATFYLVNTSHARIAIINDAKDFADLNMQAIENLSSDACEIVLTDTPTLGASEGEFISVFFKNSDTLYYQPAGNTEQKAFSMDQFTINNGTAKKWSVLHTGDPIFTRTSTAGIVHVKLQIVDNASNTVYYTLEKDMIFLNIDTATDISGSSGDAIKVRNYVP